ncbi:hypothetical protein HID58_052127 [Brassica napus]|uniref:Protein kinase domain-containing protein n=1 Tax=Brassica napus TaxID=3708 RepID=A0ABQ8AB28_BRANA|nr:hypothetical protein HID58_052127 [Brassica napus]
MDLFLYQPTRIFNKCFVVLIYVKEESFRIEYSHSKGAVHRGDTKTIMIQILYIIAFCHLQSVVQQDLKPENFLFTSKEDTLQLKAIDFGFSDYIGF